MAATGQSGVGLVLMVSASDPGAGSIVTITPAQQARLGRKAAAKSARRFDEPDLATAFYVNRRTGSLLTRGPNVTTGTPPLTPSAYIPALQQMRSMPRYSTATGTALPSADRDPSIPAPPGGR